LAAGSSGGSHQTRRDASPAGFLLPGLTRRSTSNARSDRGLGKDLPTSHMPPQSRPAGAARVILARPRL